MHLKISANRKSCYVIRWPKPARLADDPTARSWSTSQAGRMKGIQRRFGDKGGRAD